MTIGKVTASFGKLNGESLEFHDGLNIVCAPNESGKTTWCAFMRAMLYGIDTRDRRSGGYMPDKLRYAPWSGQPMQGEMELNVDGRSITLTRTTAQPNAPMQEFKAVYTGTNTPVEGLNGRNAGEVLTGVSKDVFCRSAFVGQGAVGVTGSPELEKRMSAIVSTGDENCSFSEADEQLGKWLRKRRFNRYGTLPELEKNISGVKAQLDEMKSAVQERDRTADHLAKTRQECDRLENEMNESRSSARRAALINLGSVKRELNEANEAHERADDARDAARAALCSCLIGERKPEEVQPEIEADIEACEDLREQQSKKGSSALGIVLLVLAVAAAVAGYLFYPLAYAAAGALSLIGAILTARSSRINKEAAAAEKERSGILAKYRAESEDDIRACEEEYLALYEAFEKAEAEEHRTAEKLERMKRIREQTESHTISALDFSDGKSEAALLSRQYTLAKQNAELLSERLSTLNGRLEVSGDPLVLGSELKRMEEEHSDLQSEYDAIALAIGVLREADAEIQSRFSPALGKTAGQYLAIMTGGRYDSLFVNRDFTATARAGGDSVARETGYFSTGTLDLMYLALRLAVCKLALPENANSPLILDDTLVNLDEQRTQQALTLLREIAGERQVILFSCKELE